MKLRRLRKWLEERGIWMYTIKEHMGRRKFLHLSRTELSLEYYWWKGSGFTHIGVDLGGGDTARRVTLSLGIKHLFNVYLSLDHPILEKITPGEWHDSTVRPGSRFKMTRPTFIGIRIFDGGIWFSLWENQMKWNSSDPWWWAFNIFPADILFGKTDYSERDISENQASLPMPEGSYEVKIRLAEARWKRPRWPIAKTVRRAHIDLPVPIPIPGKGENGYDCEDDAIWSMCTPAKTVNEALLNLSQSIYGTRLKYGGYEWAP